MLALFRSLWKYFQIPMSHVWCLMSNVKSPMSSWSWRSWQFPVYWSLTLKQLHLVSSGSLLGISKFASRNNSSTDTKAKYVFWILAVGDGPGCCTHRFEYQLINVMGEFRGWRGQHNNIANIILRLMHVKPTFRGGGAVDSTPSWVFMHRTPLLQMVTIRSSYIWYFKIE